MFGFKKTPKKEVKNSKKSKEVKSPKKTKEVKNKKTKEVELLEEKIEEVKTIPKKHISKEVLAQINSVLNEPSSISEIRITCLFEEDVVKKRVVDKICKIEVNKPTIDRFIINNYTITIDGYISIFQEAINCRIKEANILGISIAHMFAQMFNTDYNDIKDCFDNVTRVQLKCVYNSVPGERLKKFVTIPCETNFNHPIVIYVTKAGTDITIGLKNVEGKLLINSKEDISCCAVIDIIPV